MEETIAAINEAGGSISIQDILASASRPTEIVNPILTIDDILNSVEILTKKEAEDRSVLESIGTMSSDDLKFKLLNWAKIGFPNVHEIHRISITPPAKCSDGVSRNLAEYIEFCSSKPLQDHVAILQSKVSGMAISFANMQTYIAIVISKV